MLETDQSLARVYVSCRWILCRFIHTCFYSFNFLLHPKRWRRDDQLKWVLFTEAAEGPNGATRRYFFKIRQL
jgi:hypothetical protein